MQQKDHLEPFNWSLIGQSVFLTACIQGGGDKKDSF